MLKRIVVLLLFVQFSYTQNPSKIFDKEKKEIWDLFINSSDSSSEDRVLKENYGILSEYAPTTGLKFWYPESKKNKSVYNVVDLIYSSSYINDKDYSFSYIYNKDSGICKLFGNVKLQKGSSFLTGDYAEVDMNKGISKLLPAPSLDNFNENRVRALIDKTENYETNESN